MTTVNTSFDRREITPTMNRPNRRQRERKSFGNAQPENLLLELKRLNDDLIAELRMKYPNVEDQKYLGIYEKSRPQGAPSQA